MSKTREILNDGEIQNDNSQKLADIHRKNRQYRGGLFEIEVYGRGSNCVCCKDPSSVTWIENSGMCWMCKQMFVSVPKINKI